jgi:hypothetical protein
MAAKKNTKSLWGSMRGSGPLADAVWERQDSSLIIKCGMLD